MNSLTEGVYCILVVIFIFPLFTNKFIGLFILFSFGSSSFLSYQLFRIGLIEQKFEFIGQFEDLWTCENRMLLLNCITEGDSLCSIVVDKSIGLRLKNMSNSYVSFKYFMDSVF